MIIPSKTIQYLKRVVRGFTLVEVLLIVVVIAVLAVVILVAYGGVQRSTRDLVRRDNLKSVETRVEAYAAKNDGNYPATTTNTTANWKAIDVRTGINCFNGSAQSDWVPGFDDLPQSVPNLGAELGVDDSPGCYLYASNGIEYVLSAWNMVAEPQASSAFYRRIGFRPFQTESSTQFYTCNDNVVGGANGAYDVTKDYYKHSYTISNITDCDESPPDGA